MDPDTNLQKKKKKKKNRAEKFRSSEENQDGSGQVVEPNPPVRAEPLRKPRGSLKVRHKKTGQWKVGEEGNGGGTEGECGSPPRKQLRFADGAAMNDADGAAEEQEKKVSFHQMGIDVQILEAIGKLGWKEPTLIQEIGIPLALEGKDLHARARTGSGKTAVYAVAMLHKILRARGVTGGQVVRGLVIVPTKELGSQAARNIQDLSSCCINKVSVVNISGDTTLTSQEMLLAEIPDVIVTTPSRILSHLERNSSLLKRLEIVVVDEADLVLSFGYHDDIDAIVPHLSDCYQGIFMSATLSLQLKAFKKFLLHAPVTLKLEESLIAPASKLTQYLIRGSEEDKFVLIATLLKLQLVCGKTIIFVNTVNQGYRLKLFLQLFDISTCIVNAELPINSRNHIINQFNDSLYNYLIATDHIISENEENPDRMTKLDEEFSVSRGTDFQNVANIINFDMPPTLNAYIHRIGRTARGNASGTALSFVKVKDEPLVRQIEKELSDPSLQSGHILKPYNFKMDEVEGFRYRARNALGRVNSIAVKAARLAEIKEELLNAKQLKMHFDENSRDLKTLRHDKFLAKKMLSDVNMSAVPDYLVPKTLVKLRTHGQKKPQRKKKKTNDPLRTYKFVKHKGKGFTKK